MGTFGSPTYGQQLVDCGITNSAGTGQTAGALVHFYQVGNGLASGLLLTGNYYQGVVFDGTPNGTVLQNSIIQETSDSHCLTPPCAIPRSAGIVIERYQAPSTATGATLDPNDGNYYVFPQQVRISGVNENLGVGAAAYGIDIRSVNGLQLADVATTGGDIANFHFYPEQQNGSMSTQQWQNVSGTGNGKLGGGEKTEYGMYFEWNTALASYNAGSGVKANFGNVKLNDYSVNALNVGLGWDKSGGEPYLVGFDGCAVVSAEQAGIVIASGASDWTFSDCAVAANGFAAASATTAGAGAGSPSSGLITTSSGSTSATISNAGRAVAVGDYLSAAGIQGPAATSLPTTIATISCSGSPPDSCTGTMSGAAFLTQPAMATPALNPVAATYGVPMGIGTISATAGSTAFTIYPTPGQANPKNGDTVTAIGLNVGSGTPTKVSGTPSCSGTPVTCTGTLTQAALSTETTVPANFGVPPKYGTLATTFGTTSFRLVNPSASQANPAVGDTLIATGIPSPASGGLPTTVTAVASCTGGGPYTCSITMSTPAYSSVSSATANFGAIYAVQNGAITTTSGSTGFIISPATGQRNPIVGDNLYAKSVLASTPLIPFTTVSSITSCSGIPVACSGTMTNAAYFTALSTPLNYGAFFPSYAIGAGQRIAVSAGTIACGSTSAFGIMTSGASLLGFGAHDIGFSNYSGTLQGCLQPMLLAAPNDAYDNIGGHFNYQVVNIAGLASYQIPASTILYVDPTYDAALVTGTTSITTIEATPTDYTGRGSWDGRRITLTFVNGLTLSVAGNINTPSGSALAVTAGKSCEFSYITGVWHLLMCGG